MSSHHGGVNYEKLFFQRIFNEFHEKMAIINKKPDQTEIWREVIRTQNEFIQLLQAVIFNPEVFENQLNPRVNYVK